MTEQEYIDLSDAEKVKVARDLIKDIVPKSSSVISEEDHEAVLHKLYYWWNELHSKFNID